MEKSKKFYLPLRGNIVFHFYAVMIAQVPQQKDMTENNLKIVNEYGLYWNHLKINYGLFKL